VSQKDAHNYLQEYSIKLGPGDDPNDPASEQRGVMVIKSKSKTRAKQRKGAVSNWKARLFLIIFHLHLRLRFSFRFTFLLRLLYSICFRFSHLFAWDECLHVFSCFSLLDENKQSRIPTPTNYSIISQALLFFVHRY
jgi:hypothetical protein